MLALAFASGLAVATGYRVIYINRQYSSLGWLEFIGLTLNLVTLVGLLVIT